MNIQLNFLQNFIALINIHFQNVTYKIHANLIFTFLSIFLIHPLKYYFKQILIFLNFQKSQ
jgi:hypothetical protein